MRSSLEKDLLVDPGQHPAGFDEARFAGQDMGIARLAVAKTALDHIAIAQSQGRAGGEGGLRDAGTDQQRVRGRQPCVEVQRPDLLGGCAGFDPLEQQRLALPGIGLGGAEFALRHGKVALHRRRLMGKAVGAFFGLRDRQPFVERALSDADPP